MIVPRMPLEEFPPPGALVPVGEAVVGVGVGVVGVLVGVGGGGVDGGEVCLDFVGFADDG